MKKKGITTWIRKKKVRYAAAGTLCLAAAIGILALGLGIGSRAAETVKLGTGLSENFEVAYGIWRHIWWRHRAAVQIWDRQCGEQRVKPSA